MLALIQVFCEHKGLQPSGKQQVFGVFFHVRRPQTVEIKELHRERI